MNITLQGRIDSSNAQAIEAQLSSVPAGAIIIDAEKLEYISSAGLRVLMKLRKSHPEGVTVLNVSPEVYDILDMTGFTELLEVHKALRELSVEGLPVIGAGATAKVYRIDRETVVKVFNPNTSVEIIRQENERGRNAFLNGIPTAIAYDMVKVGDCYGSVYELLDAQDFLTILENDKAHLAEHIAHFAHAIKAMHRVEVDPVKFPPTKQGSLAALPLLGGICTQEEIDKLKRLYEAIPDRNTFLHADCHPGNVMVQNGEFVFIDLMTCGSGHPVFDLGSMCTVYHMPPKFGSREASPLTRNFTEEESAQIWNTYLRSYLETDDAALLAKAERQITAISAARTLFAAVFIPGLLPPDRIEYMKRVALDYVDSAIEPLCF